MENFKSGTSHAHTHPWLPPFEPSFWEMQGLALGTKLSYSMHPQPLHACQALSPPFMKKRCIFFLAPSCMNWLLSCALHALLSSKVLYINPHSLPCSLAIPSNFIIFIEALMESLKSSSPICPKTCMKLILAMKNHCPHFKA